MTRRHIFLRPGACRRLQPWFAGTLCQGPSFQNRILTIPILQCPLVDLLHIHLHDLLPHGFGFNLWLIGRLERQCGIICCRGEKTESPSPRPCSMLSVTKEHERTGSFMPCVGGQSGVQDAYLQLVIKRCHKSQNRRTRWAPLLARQADNWAEYEAVRA